MGWLTDLFSSQKKEQTDSSQTGQSATQGNLWPQIQPYLQDYLNQYSSSNIGQSGQAPINAYQTAAGNQQTGVANTAAGIANAGISPNAIQAYMSPYIQSVVDPTVQAFKDLNAATTSDINGSLAKSGALGNSNNSATRARVLAPIQNQQQAQIAGLYNTGYGQAANTAQADVAARLGGLNAQTGANTSLGNIGQNIWGSQYANALTPFQLQNQGVSGLSTLGQIAGSNTQSSGTATGTGTTTASPSLGGVLSGLAGTALSGFAEGGKVDGLVSAYSSDSLHDKVGKAFKLFQGLRKEASGGQIPAYGFGGDVGMESWFPTVTPEPVAPPSSTFKDMGSSLTDFSKKVDAPDNSGGSALGAQRQALSQFLSGLGRAEGGEVGDFNSAVPILPFSSDDPMTDPSQITPPASRMPIAPYESPSVGATEPMHLGAQKPSASTSGQSWLPFSSGVWAGEQMSPTQRLGAALTQVGDSPFAGFGKAMFESNEGRLKQLEQERQNRALGLEAAMNPAKIEQLNASAALARTQADKEFLLDIEKKKLQFAKELELQQMKNKFDLFQKITQAAKPGKMTGALNPGVYNWVGPGTSNESGDNDTTPEDAESGAALDAGSP